MANKKRLAVNKEENYVNDFVDRINKFEEFQKDILPMLRADIANGTPPEELIKKYRTHLAARQVTIALTEVDANKALAAIKDLRDRDEGKAVNREEVTHKYENMREEEIESILLSKLKDNDISKDDKKH